MPALDLAVLQLPQKHLHTLQTLLAEHVPTAVVWAYGSRVTGGAHEGSDLDLVLRNPVDLQQDVEGWVDLKEALQNSLLPIRVDVHLWSHLPPSFYPNIEAGYVVVQEPQRGLGAADEWRTALFGELTVNHDAKRKPVKESDRRPGPYPY